MLAEKPDTDYPGSPHFPGIAEEQERQVVRRMGHTFTCERDVGDVLHPERESREMLDQVRETHGEYYFAANISSRLRPWAAAW